MVTGAEFGAIANAGQARPRAPDANLGALDLHAPKLSSCQ